MGRVCIKLKSMDKSTKMWVASTKAWIKQQKISIESCELAICQSMQNIEINQRKIKAEAQERLLKVKHLKEVEKTVAKYV